jgi:SAM-dependent methyltransferase
MSTRPAVKRLTRGLKKLARRTRLFPYYQEQRSESADSRWRLIEARLEETDRNLLDIGCNVGMFTARAAERGMIALGFDPLEEAVAHAQGRWRDRRGLAFMWLEASPDDIARLPAFDVTLCLSVHHYWYRAHGEEGAWAMIGEMAAKSGKFFFEPASAHRRYGEAKPRFVENDEASIRDYVARNFDKLFGTTKRVECLGQTPSLHEEPFRLMFLIR